MKVNLPKGEAQVDINYKTEPLTCERLKEQFPEGVRTTSLVVTLPSGEKLETKVACHTGDVFTRKQGRKRAFLKLIDNDSMQAVDLALEEFQGNVLKKDETANGLYEAAKKHYKLSREDRSALFAVICPEYFRNTPERRAKREKALFERLSAKYLTLIPNVSGPEGRPVAELNNVKSLSVTQNMGDVTGTVIGVSIDNLGSVPRTTNRRKAAK